MKSKNLPVEDTLPIKLKIKVLQAELERVESDLDRLDGLRTRIVEEIRHYEDLLTKTQRPQILLRRVK